MYKYRTPLVAALFAGMATIAAAKMAKAADLPPPPPPPMVEIRPATYDWSGAYVGISIGVGSIDNTYIPIGAPDPDLSGSGVMLGGFIGYNTQWNNMVAGVEADGMATWIKPRNRSDGVDQHATYLSTIRARLGWAHNNTLFYGTAGVGFMRTKIHILPADETRAKTHVGYVVGGGIEHGFTPNVTARMEYLYGSFNNKNYVYTPGTVRTGIDHLHIVRAGMAYKF